MEEVFDPDRFVAKWYCSAVGPEHMPQFAADALEAGYDGPALRRLAGMVRPTSSDIGGLFQDALGEIGAVKIHSKEQAILARSRAIAVDIVEGRLDPIQGADILASYYRSLDYYSSGHLACLAEFFELSEMAGWGDYAPSQSQLVKDIIEHARLLLNVPG